MKKPKTYGLTHLSIAVKNIDKTLTFYQKVFDMEVMYHQDDFLQVTTPGSNDIMVFEKKDADYGNTGGIAHFGFRLRKANDIDEIAEKVKRAGGIIREKCLSPKGELRLIVFLLVIRGGKEKNKISTIKIS